MTYKALVHKASQMAGWIIACKLGSLYKISFMLGSTAIFFSSVSCVTPLMGAFSGAALCTVVFCLRLFAHCAVTHPVSYAWLALYVPGWCAALSWSYATVVTRVLLPLVCMVLFILHPESTQAWVYTLYWLVPMVIYWRASTSIFAQSLSSTFIAHAVGSVIRQYTVPMTCGAWLVLIPVVLVERMVFALGMTALYYVIMQTKDVAQRLAIALQAPARVQSSYKT